MIASRIFVLIMLTMVAASCKRFEIRFITPTSEPPTLTLLPYPDALDTVVVHDAVTAAVNQARIEHGLQPLVWDETLQELAEWQAWQIVKGTRQFDELDDWPATQLGELVVELRACLSDNVTTPDAVAQIAVGRWLDDPELHKMLLDRWQRIGTGFDWGCPMERGVVLVVLLAGRAELREG